MKDFINGLIVGIVATIFFGFLFLNKNENSFVLNESFSTDPIHSDKTTLVFDEYIDNPASASTKSKIEKKLNNKTQKPEANSKNIHCDIGLLAAIRQVESNSEKDPAQLNSELQDAFLHETIDQEWASPYQSNLENLIRNDDLLRNNLPDTIECRSTSCLMSIRYYSAEEREKITEQLLTVIAKNNHGIHPDTVISPNEYTQSLDIIFKRSP